MSEQKKIPEILFQLGEQDLPYGAIAPPVVRTSNFAFQTVDAYSEAISDEKNNSVYSRGNNPTVRLAEIKLAALQQTEDALLFGSGSAAIAAAVMATVKSGDHVIIVRHAYSWSYQLFARVLSRLGVSFSEVDGRDNDAVIKALKPETTLLFLESPTSFNFQLQDIAVLIPWARSKGLTVIYDNSYGTPLNRKPVEYGADYICHSATKFIGGHSDVVAGLVCGNQSMINHLFHHSYLTMGAILSADNASLLLRGMRTLPIRIENAAQSARTIVEFLRTHPAIEKVIWPFDDSHPQHALAESQFDIVIPMFAFHLKTHDPVKIKSFCDGLKIPRIAASWGGYESLIMPAIAFKNTDHPAQHIRMYVGLEGAPLLISDLQQALQLIS